MNDPLRQSLQVATRLESGEILRTEDDYAAVNEAAARAGAAAAAAAEQPETISSGTTSTPAESGAGEEIEDDG